MTTREYKKFKDLKKENLRDNDNESDDTFKNFVTAVSIVWCGDASVAHFVWSTERRQRGGFCFCVVLHTPLLVVFCCQWILCSQTEEYCFSKIGEDLDCFTFFIIIIITFVCGIMGRRIFNGGDSACERCCVVFGITLNNSFHYHPRCTRSSDVGHFCLADILGGCFVLLFYFSRGNIRRLLNPNQNVVNRRTYAPR